MTEKEKADALRYKLRDLKLHESYYYFENGSNIYLRITRVSGGWIYERTDGDSAPSWAVFVPHSYELLQ